MASKGTQVTVLYPRKEGAKFDLDYYLATHMPMVDNHWKKHGLKSFSVTQLGPDAPYSISTTMEWESSDAFKGALGDPGTKGIMSDIANFSSEQPVLMAGDVVGRG